MSPKLANKRLSVSSGRWVRRQLDDPYVKRAAADGYRARSAYKLLEIDDKYHILRRGAKVVDLGCAPGSWSQVAVARAGKGCVVGLDLLEVKPVAGAALLQMDFMAPDAGDALKTLLGGRVGAVICDIAPNTTGHAATDAARLLAILTEALAFAEEVLAERGSFVAKVFEGGDYAAIMARLKAGFETIRRVKPAASRKESKEIYLVATGRRILRGQQS
ncbi:ribosomal RNA large subunit methyltransferase E [Alphaproteobacteria bacterium]|nr:ribosomal RNA large subunit methyltransferase E [Alphaproteobacteria bacterium]